MTDRVLDLSLHPVRLSIRGGLLVIQLAGEEIDAVPCQEISAVLISNRQVTFTQAVLGELAKGGATTVLCDEKSMPAAMVLPLDAHHAQAERFRLQAALGAPCKKRLWQSIVRAKILAQAKVLDEVTGSDHGLRALISKVLSGDTSNVEARAARRYWSKVFGEASFVRADSEDPRNHLLNYGYAVLRAITARAICGAGLHPSFSLYHANVHNPFGLADDLMEPFRPVVDRIAHSIQTDSQPEGVRELTPAVKRRLIANIVDRLSVDGEQRTLPEILVRLAQSLAAVVIGIQKSLWLPGWDPLPTPRE